jgi:hypothetical protein
MIIYDYFDYCDKIYNVFYGKNADILVIIAGGTNCSLKK